MSRDNRDRFSCSQLYCVALQGFGGAHVGPSSYQGLQIGCYWAVVAISNAAESFYCVFFFTYSHAAMYARASSVPGSKFSRSITSRHQWKTQANGSERLMSSPTTA